MNDQWLCTRSGIKFDPVCPTVEMIEIEDIAWGLAHTHRFGGQAPVPYTVAQHSVEVARMLPTQYALWGLLHDAAEAYLWDVQRPVKAAQQWDFNASGRMIPFRVIEHRILVRVAAKFDLTYMVPEAVGRADFAQLLRERRDLFDDRQPVWPGCDGKSDLPPIEIPTMTPAKAFYTFLAEFERLTGQNVC